MEPQTVSDLPADWREHYEERAAIREYEGRQSRSEAEAAALAETLAAMNGAESALRGQRYHAVLFDEAVGLNRSTAAGSPVP